MGKYELFWLSGTFWKGQSFICWLSKKPYATGSAGLEPWNTLGLLGWSHGQVPWRGECIELRMAVNLTPSSVPRLPVNALEMAPLEPKVPRNLRKPPRREQTSKDTRQMATWVPICNWNTNLFPVGITVEDSQGLRSLFKTHGWGPEWEDSATDSLCDIRQSWAALDVSLWVKWADWNSGSQGPSKSQCPWFRVW